VYFGDLYPSSGTIELNDKTIPLEDSSRDDIKGANVEGSVNNNYKTSILGFFMLIVALLLVTSKM
jgi:hypothetical protein